MACKAPLHRSEYFTGKGLRMGVDFATLLLSERKAGPVLAFGQHMSLFFCSFPSRLKWVDPPVTLDIG